MRDDEEELTNDLLTGGKAIAEYLGPGWDKNKIFRAKYHLPIGRVGRILFARKSELRRKLSGAA